MAYIFSDHYITVVQLIWGTRWACLDWRLRHYSDIHPARIVRIVLSSVFVSLTVALKVIYQKRQVIGQLVWQQAVKKLTPPVVLFLKTTSGLLLFNLIPTASNSISRRRRCSSDFVASSIIRTRSAVFAAEIQGVSKMSIQSRVEIILETTWRPRPRPALNNE